MTTDEHSKYRKRIDDDSTGLIREDPRPVPAGGLVFEKLADVATGSTALALTAIADQVLPSATEDETALGDYGLAQLAAEHASGRAREILERAHPLVSGGKWRPALIAIEEALAADPTSGEAWALKGRCLKELGLHEAALRVFRYAREQVSDPQLRILILKLEADCVQASTRVLEAQIVQLAEKNQLDEALALVKDALCRQPSNIVFLHHLANLQWRSGNPEAARQTIQEAHRHVGRDGIDLIADLERKIDFGPHFSAVESARLSLRQGDTAAAIRNLDSCAATLKGNVHYEGLRAYAEGKRRAFTQFLGAKGHAQAVSLQQQTLRWVVAEEIHQADHAMRTGDYARAREALEAASRIEPDCGAVLYKLANAIVVANRARPITEELKQAEAMASRSAVDSAYQELAAELVQKIRNLRLAGD
jgi:tetratricopeptide (TPR) repeat protein